MLNIDGLATGIDTETIIAGLLEIQQRQIDQLESRKSETGIKQASFSGIETRLLSLRNSLSKLTNRGGDVFLSKTAVSSDENLVLAAASSDAPLGSYQITIGQLAQSHQVASQGFADKADLITQGELQIQVGSGASIGITVDSSNDTLQGLVDTINRSDAEVTAAIVNDGSGAAPHRLLLTSQKTGAAQDIRITNNLAVGGDAAARPDFDLANPIADPLDAKIALGSGAGAISVSAATNTVEDVIPGVTLDLRGQDAGKTVNIGVANNSDDAVDAAGEFVEQFNDLMSYIQQQARFTAETEDAGPLLGNRTVIRIQDEVRLLVTESIAGLNPQLNRLTAAGFSLEDDGKLSLNEGRLRDLLEGRVEGVGSEDVARLFALGGGSDRSGVSFVFGSTRTQAGEVQVDVTSAAETAVLTGAASLAASTALDSANDSLSIQIDGASAALKLVHGTYTRQELADMLQEQINGRAELAGREVEVSLDGDRLRVQSRSFGSGSEVLVQGGSSLADLGLAAGQSARGQDVVGSFLADGQTEPATGRGTLLVGDADNERTADLQARVSLTNAQLAAGPEATLTVTRGVASQLDQLLGGLLDPVNGRVQTENDRYDEQIESIEQSIERLKARFDAAQQALLAEFVALESTVSELQNTGNFLASQLGGLTAFGQ